MKRDVMYARRAGRTGAAPATRSPNRLALYIRGVKRAAPFRRAARVASAAVLLAGCAGGTAAPPPPVADFLVASLDSTYWVTSGAGGVRLRGAPLTVAAAGGRFYELFVADDDRSFYDAVLVGQRLYRRDLLTNDSAVVFADSVVPRLASGYAAAHPAEHPLGADELPSDEPELVANAEVELAAVHGPYATYEYHADVEHEGAESRYATRVGVVDWRTGQSVSLAALFGPAAARSIVAEGRRRFRLARDSVRRSDDPRAPVARAALASFSFDERSFGLTAVGGRVAVRFVVPGRGRDAGGLIVPLAPIHPPLDPAWWSEARRALAAPGSDASLDRWSGHGYDVLARHSDSSASLALADRAGREWPVGRVQPSAVRVLWLDQPELAPPTRHALQRAFDESALYDAAARLVARPRPGPSRPRRGSLVSHRRRVAP